MEGASADPYEVDYNIKKEFPPNEFEEYKKMFKTFDADKSGAIDRAELGDALRALGWRDISEEKIDQILGEADANQNNQIEFDEFLALFLSLRTGHTNEFAEIMTRNGKKITQVHSERGTVHSYSDEEKSSFVEYVNYNLRNDPDLQHMLPIDPTTEDIFKVFQSGVLLCKLVNIAAPGTIDERVINKGTAINIFKTKENLNLGLQAAKSIGCKVISIYPEEIIEGRPHLILGLMWQIVKIRVLSSVSLKSHPELIRLAKEGEELADLLKLQPEHLLLRWFNYHLEQAEHDRRVKNFSSDVKDSECYTILLNQISPEKCSKDPLNTEDVTERAAAVIENAEKIGAQAYVRPTDISTGNSKLNLLFTSSIFNANSGLTEATEEEQVEAAQLLDDDVEGSREERAFRMWMNSLGTDVYINNLYEDIKDGLVMLKVLDRVEPGAVTWKKVAFKPNNRFKKVQNANYAVDVGKAMGFSLVGIGGIDIVDGNKKLILALVWQLVRKHTLQVIGNSNDEELLNWANTTCSGADPIKSFRDKTIASGNFLLKLIDSIQPGCINWDLATPGENEEDIQLNAKYIISAARKMGATVFLVWEDIKDVKPKMILTLIAGLAQVQKNMKSGQGTSAMPELNSTAQTFSSFM